MVKNIRQRNYRKRILLEGTERRTRKEAKGNDQRAGYEPRGTRFEIRNIKD